MTNYPSIFNLGYPGLPVRGPCEALLQTHRLGRKETMGKMAIEIAAFLVATAGWVLVSSTLPTDYWKVSSNDGTVITTATFWCNLWKVCVTDSTGVSNCKDFPSMLALEGYIQVCRGLMIAAVCLGFFATACALVGMKCTKIGGSDQLKARIACFSGLQYFIGGMNWGQPCSLVGRDRPCAFWEGLCSSCHCLMASAKAQVTLTGDDISIGHPLMFLVLRRHKTIQPMAEGPRQNTVAPRKILIKMPMYDVHKRKKQPHFHCHNHSGGELMYYNKKTDG
ncbi:claudin-10 isoform X1 [Pangasianodon hypophthalmus]|uniref:claudin-10 isoform X1 n=1 Tax=Pangasianodon hypophthalmus TaxID=310915 RepID=UPI0023072115|nr:claudin-10 isoform X1 [Pangasianodon hypophthalmus]